jgi:CheY-like chemotaxis protein
MTRVLVIEDNELNLDMVTRRLTRAGLEVLSARDGASGLDRARAEQPDVVLLDISLPDMDGVEVVRRLRADEATRGLRVIALTAHAMPEDRARALDAGCDDYDTKPVEMARLLSKIDALLGRAPR